MNNKSDGLLFHKPKSPLAICAGASQIAFRHLICRRRSGMEIDMIISSIDETNKPVFEKLMPEEQYLLLNRPSVFALGAIWEDEGGKSAAGTLVFSVEEGSSDDEEMVAARILWLYIAPEYRGQRVADQLMDAFFGVMDESGIEYALCDIPMPEEYNLLCAYLEAWGFHFGMVNRYDLTVELGELSKKKEFQKKQAVALHSLQEVPQPAFGRFVKSVLELPGVWQDLPYSLKEYECSVSCVYMDGKNIEGALLVQYAGNGVLDVVLLRTLINRPALMAGLICYALRAAEKKYAPDTQVRIVCRSEAAVSLLGGLFPDAEPLLVRRGCYYSGEDEMENRDGEEKL